MLCGGLAKMLITKEMSNGALKDSDLQWYSLTFPSSIEPKIISYDRFDKQVESNYTGFIVDKNVMIIRFFEIWEKFSTEQYRRGLKLNAQGLKIFSGKFGGLKSAKTIILENDLWRKEEDIPTFKPLHPFPQSGINAGN